MCDETEHERRRMRDPHKAGAAFNIEVTMTKKRKGADIKKRASTDGVADVIVIDHDSVPLGTSRSVTTDVRRQLTAQHGTGAAVGAHGVRPRVHTYMVAYDGGCAPCHENGLTTMNVCKTQTRACARVGDVVVGLVGANLARRDGPRHGDILWIGVVSAVMTMKTYAQAFPGREDAMYEFTADGAKVKSGQPWGVRDVKKDLGGKNALVFGRVMRFSRAAVNGYDAGLCFGKGTERGPARATLRTEIDAPVLEAILDKLAQVADAYGASFHLSE